MPVKCTKKGCRYGRTGKLYKGKDAKKKAHKQEVAIILSQRRRGKRVK